MIDSHFTVVLDYINKTNSHDITEILLEVALNTITLSLSQLWILFYNDIRIPSWSICTYVVPTLLCRHKYWYPVCVYLLRWKRVHFLIGILNVHNIVAVSFFFYQTIFLYFVLPSAGFERTTFDTLQCLFALHNVKTRRFFRSLVKPFYSLQPNPLSLHYLGWSVVKVKLKADMHYLYI